MMEQPLEQLAAMLGTAYLYRHSMRYRAMLRERREYYQALLARRKQLAETETAVIPVVKVTEPMRAIGLAGDTEGMPHVRKVEKQV